MKAGSPVRSYCRGHTRDESVLNVGGNGRRGSS